MRPAYVLGLGVTGLAAIRSLARRGIPVYGATWNPADPTLSTRYCRATVCPDPATSPQELAEFLIRHAGQASQPPVLFTTADAATLFVAQHSAQLHDHYRFHPLPAALVDSLINKRKQYELASSHNIPIPLTFSPTTVDDARELAHKLTFPVLIKPCYGHLWRKVYANKGFQATDISTLIERLTHVFENNFEVLLQSVVSGPATNLYSVCCYIGANHEVLALMTQRKIRQFPLQHGVGTLVESAPCLNLSGIVVRFLQEVGYCGPAEVEFKRDERDSEFKLIEFNVRLWEQNALAAACGLDFPYAQYLDLTGQPREPKRSYRTHVRWLALWEDAHAAAALWRRGGLGLAGWVASLLAVRVHARFAWDDPGPCLRHYLKEIFSAARALVRKVVRTASRWFSPRHPTGQKP